MTLAASGTLTVDLEKYFNEAEGEALTYTATSTDEAAATASVSGSMLTVTAVAAGSATITVTAMDTDSLTAKQTFGVTVTAADTTPEPETPDPGTITISDTKKVPVDLNDHIQAGADAADYVLESRDKTVFTAGPKSTSTGPSKSVWEVNPVSEGTAKAEIISKTDATVVKTLTVVVQNRPPGPHPTAPVITKRTLTGPVSHVPPIGAPATKRALKNENGDDGLQLYYVSLPVAGQFKDPDADDQLTYKITSSREDVLVRDGSSCTLSPCKVWVDILKKRNSDDFDLDVVAEDPDKATSTVTVMFPISMEYPAKQTYNVHQRTTGSFRSITVGDRSSDETEHTLKFIPTDPAADGHTTNANDWHEFVLADRLIRKLDEIEALVPSTQNAVTPSDNATAITPVGVPPATGTAPNKIVYYNEVLPDLAKRTSVPIGDAMIDAYTVNTTGRVSVAPKRIGTSMESLTFGSGEDTDAATETTENDIEPALVFTVSGVGPGTIEIGYHVWWDADGDGAAEAKWHSVKETLAVTVVAVES